MKRYLFTVSVMLMVLVGLLANSGYGAVPRLINYQGRLADATGTPVPDGSYNITFRIYNVAAGGAAIWTEVQMVKTTDGLFSVLLGNVTPLNIDFNEDYWLGIQVGANPEMTPRRRMAASGYAINADTLDGQDSTAFAPVAHTHNDQYYTRIELNTGDGAINQGADPVHWTKLKGVPGDFADGIDNVGGVTDNSVLTQHIVDGTILNQDISDNAVTTVKIADGAVISAKLAPGAVGDAQVPDTHTHADGSIDPQDVIGTAWTSTNDGSGSGLDADLLDGQDSTAFAQAGHSHGIDTIGPNILSSLDGIVNDGGDIDLVAGSNITITPDDLNNQITISATGGGDITSVGAGSGLIGGGESGDVTLNVGAGTGILVAEDSISLTPSYQDGSAYDGRFINDGAGEVGNDDISVTAGKVTNLNADLLDGQDSTAFATTVHTHDDRYYTEIELNTSDGDGPNAGSNRVHWDNLNGVPPDFADNTDNTGRGDGHSLDAADGNPVDAVYVDNSGNVGIGTTSPGTKLDVAGTVQLRGAAGGTGLYVNSSGNVGIGTTGPSEKLQIEAGSIFLNGEGQGIIVDAAGFKRVGFMKYRGLEGMLIGDASSPLPIRLGRWSGGTIKSPSIVYQDLVINPAGNVGIGTTGPSVKLHVHEPSTSLSGVLLNTQATGSSYYSLNVQSGGTSRFYVRADGNVGIGTTSPDEKFEVEWIADGTDVEIGRGTTNTNITFIALRNANGTKCYIYPNATADGLVVTTTKP